MPDMPIVYDSNIIMGTSRASIFFTIIIMGECKFLHGEKCIYLSSYTEKNFKCQ